MIERFVFWIFPILAAVAAVSIEIAHNFGMLEWASPWLKEYSPVLSVVLFAIIATILNPRSSEVTANQKHDAGVSAPLKLFCNDRPDNPL